MRSTKTGPETRAVTDTPARSHPGGVISANIRSAPATGVRAPAMHRRALTTTCGAPAMACCALAMNFVEVPRVRGCLSGAVRIAHESAKVEPVVVRNFAPALPRLM